MPSSQFFFLALLLYTLSWSLPTLAQNAVGEGWSQNVQPQFSEAPLDSWELWVQKIHQGQDVSLERPDGKNPLLALPLWVDCHLSWLFANREALKLKNAKIPEMIVLQSSASQCAGQMEKWSSQASHSKTH